ncbi:helix-turn-helix domain-containing protein [Flavobacterium sp. xlx-214]|uniref:helix-turn-helix transcriptional regulator n=1 Tax=unclassified Flavobacterium TaxID=196869 RepID=UPI0013CFF654|nr:MULTISPECIES: helix-turn-helix transcriptional regulator [unclassified Flavobacterium]MBA5791838.1 helix-turn-helix domain-containing protein [Flavobacterium sp. xlx-221]QMI83075.1 helix-turn-helix domain-containing protein [Flavobacterium sp. xlx-214]
MSEIQLLGLKDFKNKNVDEQFYTNTIPKHLQNNHSRIEKAHKHNFYAVFLFTKGFGTHEIDFNKYEVKPGSVFFLYPGQTHSWELSDDIDGYLFFHSEEFYEINYVRNSIKDYPFFESNTTEKCVHLNLEQKEFIEKIFVSIYQESLQNQWKKKQLILSYLTQLYIHLNRYIETHSAINFTELRHYQSLFAKFEKLVDQYFSTIKSATQYADLLSITQKHLNRIVKSISGKTTTDIITDRVILEAKRQLLYTNNSLNEIATDLGFDDYTYFSKNFKKRVAMKPSDFRKLYKEEE